MERLSSDPDPSPDRTNGKRWKNQYRIMVCGESYITVKTLANQGAENGFGSCTRVFRAYKESDKLIDADKRQYYAIKDNWLERGLRTEYEIYKDIMQRIEAHDWQGPWAEIAEPVPRNSTGTLIQRVGGERYVLAGSSDGAVFVYSYPTLQERGKLRMDLPPFNGAGTASRVWPNVVPLPEGYPARYLALMMDRANFPGVVGDTWSYGAMYVYWAFTEDISGPGYEFPPR